MFWSVWVPGLALQVLAPEPVQGQFVPLITLGTFLVMAAALLMCRLAWSMSSLR